MTLKETVQERTFWHILTMLVLSMSFGYFMKVSYKNYGGTQFKDDAFLTTVAGVGFLVGTLSRLFWGVLQDHIGFKKVYFFILLIQILVSFTMTQVSSSRGMYLLWVSLSFSCEGGHMSIFPPLATAIYGAE